MPPGVTLRTEFTDAPLQVRADVTQLHQVLMNLCTNAWQAHQGQPGEVTVGLAGCLRKRCWPPAWRLGEEPTGSRTCG